MKRAMVWGASGGIGQAVVQELLAREWQVLATVRADRTNDGYPLWDTTSMTAPTLLEVDVADPYAVAVAVREAAQLVEEVDLWIYTVGDIAVEKVESLAIADWQRIIDANLNGVFYTTHYSLPLLTEQAHLFYVGAITERLRLPGFSAYVAAKSGLESYVAALQKEERKRRITLLRPGAVDTPFWQKVPMRLPASALKPIQVAQALFTAYENETVGAVELT